MNLKNKHTLVVGLGKSGVSVARFLVKQGAVVTVTDNSSEESLQQILPEIRALGITAAIGRHDAEIFEKADLIILSPGVPHTIEPVEKARRKNIPVIGEVELAYRFMLKPIIAITGTNGKSTTTLLLGKMLEESGFNAAVGGNIGTPLIELVEDQDSIDFIVAEISSFQLDTIDRFKPYISMILNITDDHLERYPDFEAYASSKARIFENQDSKDICILNDNDHAIKGVSAKLSARHFAFNCSGTLKNRAWVSGTSIGFNLEDGQEHEIDCTDIPLSGRHNLENAAAAGLAALSAGASVQGITKALNTFQGLSHRVEYVATINDVKYFDDSKATNVDAVARAIESFASNIVLIMGGRDKGGSYERLFGPVENSVRNLIVMGEAGEIIKTAFEDIVPTIKAKSMKDAVRIAESKAIPGDIVLLSPACSSFDMYESYAQRGDDFSREVNALERSLS